jgi:mannosidase alpha-like ER degradation enhancer 2
MWNESIVAINQYLRDETKGRMKPELWYGHADMNTGQRTHATFGALDAFFPAVLALSGDLNRASLLQESSYKMWMKNSIEPEEFNYQTMEVVSPGYPLRPEIVESTYYLYHYALQGAETARLLSLLRRRTRHSQAGKFPPLNEPSAKLDPEYYQRMGAMMFQDFVKYCRTEAGYAALKSVVTKEKTDSMQSFLFAETFKYFYLLFAPAKTLDFNTVVFNTEAHPVRRIR